MNKVYIGIDNGVSGSIGWVDNNGESGFCATPVFKTLNYQKTANKLNRVDVNALELLLMGIMELGHPIALVERPMVNPSRFKASTSALRALEATLIVLEKLNIGIQYVDSKEWQKYILPSGLKGSPVLKKASIDIGIRIFPQFEKEIRKQKDADGILIAEWARRINL